MSSMLRIVAVATGLAIGPTAGWSAPATDPSGVGNARRPRPVPRAEATCTDATPDALYVTSFDNGLYLIPPGPGPAELECNLPTDRNEDICFDPLSGSFVVSSDDRAQPVYRLPAAPDCGTGPVAVPNVARAESEIACSPFSPLTPGLSDILVAAELIELVRWAGDGSSSEVLCTSSDDVDGPVGLIEGVDIDLRGTTPCGPGTIFLGTTTGVIAIRPDRSKVRLVDGAQLLQLGVDQDGASPFDFAAASFFDEVIGYSIDPACTTATGTVIFDQDPNTGDDLCFDSVGNIILPLVLGGEVLQIGTGSDCPLGDTLVLAASGDIPDPIGCTVRVEAAPPAACDLRPLEAKLDVLEPKVDDLQVQVTDIRSDVTEIQSDVTDLKADVTDLKAEVTDVKAEVTDVKAELVDLKAEMTDLKAEVAAVQLTLDELPCEVIRLFAALHGERLPTTHPCRIAPAP